MSYTPLLKTAKSAWANQLTRLPCLVVYVMYTTTSQLSLASTSHNVQLGRGF